MWLVQITLDGYSAPLTAGHFANLVRQFFRDAADEKIEVYSHPQ